MGTSSDPTAVKNLLCEIASHDEQDVEKLQPLLSQLATESTPSLTMDLLAPRLLMSDDSNDFPLSNQQALSIVLMLATSDPATYLKPASHSVMTVAEQSLTTADTTLQVSDQLLAVLVAQLSGENVQVSFNAAAAVAACCRKLGPSLSDRAIPSITSTWNQVWEGQTDKNRHQNTTIAVRCATAVVQVACQSDSAMESAISSGATRLLLVMMTDSSDPLLQISVLDMLEQLATVRPLQSTRAHWLFSNEVLDPLLQMAGQEDSPDPILGGPALRVLSKICRLGQQDATLFRLGGPQLLTGFHHCLRNFDAGSELERLALIDAISSFASASPQALDVVLQDTYVRQAWLSVQVAQPKLKSAILVSVSHVLDPPAEKDTSGDTITTSNVPSNADALRLFSMLGNINDKDATELTMSLARAPIVETRLGAYVLLQAVAKRGTGAQVLLSHGGFYEFLISRQGETTKEGKEAKHEIIVAIMKSQARDLLASNIVDQFETILQQGPHYVKSQRMELETE